MKKQILKKSIIDKALAVGLLVLIFIMSAIKSEASIPNSYLTFSAVWSGNKCTATTEPDPPVDNPLLYANAVVYEYNSAGTLLGFDYDYKTTYNTNAVASVSKSNVNRARVVGYLTSGSNSTGTSYGFVSRYINKNDNL